jgi:hypothetical protein
MFGFKRFSMALLLVVVLTAGPAWAAGNVVFTEDQKPTGGEMMWDTFALRPIGMVATAVGAVVWAISYPFAHWGGNTDESTESLVKEPFEWTFERPLGQF